MRQWLLLAAWLVQSSAFGQDWSAEQREIIDLVARCNDAWARSVQAKNFDIFAAACPETAASVVWYTGTAQPTRYARDEGLWANSAAAGSTLSWRNLVPKAVDVDGDLALVYFEVDWSFETAAGERGENSTRRLLVLRRVDGQWRIAGGTVAAVR